MDEVKLLPCEELVEAVARAIWEAQYESGTSWDDWADHVARAGGFDGRDTSRKLARAAIAAMPTLVTGQLEGDDKALIERVRDFIYDATKDESNTGWTLSEHQTRDLIALAHPQPGPSKIGEKR